MISTVSLWLPIVLTAVGVFVASSLVHMVFKWHNPEYWKLGNEDEVRAAIRNGNPKPGLYMLPNCSGPEAMNSPEIVQKFVEGPVGMLTLRPAGKPGMATPLLRWLAFNLAVAAFCAHIATRALPAGAAPTQVFHLVALVSFLTYGGGSVQSGIWMGLPWRAVTKDLLDAIIYGVVAGLLFAWLWP